MAASVGSAAWADCLPNPLTYGGTAVCAGTTTGNYTVNADTSSVTVGAGATLQAAPGDLSAFTATSQPYTIYGPNIRLNLDGHIDGGLTAAGVLVTDKIDGSSYDIYYPAPTNLFIYVGATGVLEGANAIRLTHDTNGVNTRTSASLTNSGIVRSTTGGPAITVTDTTRESFSTIVNQAGGFIGGIQGVVAQLTNRGTIDGGTNSAYAFAGPYSTTSPTSLNNTGVIRSSNAVATMDFGFGSQQVTNDGQVINTGSGLAIKSAESLWLVNSTNATITGGGPIAIQAGGAITLVNRGTINGSVISQSIAGQLNAQIDTFGGHINGDVLLGAADDLLVGTFDAATGKIAEISGRVDGGGGLNTLRLTIAQNSTLDGLLEPSALPTNFQKFQLNLIQGAVATFNNDMTNGLKLVGADGGLVTHGKLTTTGVAVNAFSLTYGQKLDFTNTGVITATYTTPYLAPDAYAIDLGTNFYGVNSFRNSGQIFGVNSGGAYLAFNYGSAGMVNDGAIVADGQALYIAGGAFTNNGVIRSNTGRAVYAALNGGTIRSLVSTNNGVIEGVTQGVVLSSVTLANAGKVSASNGVAVNPGWYSQVDNLAGGVITGSKAAISFEGYGYNAIISNAGVINGDVDLTSSSVMSGDVFYDKGGTLNGSLLLGSGDDTLYTDLSRIKNGKFTWLTGAFDAGDGYDQLILSVTQDGSAALDNKLGFENVSYELQNDAALTLTSSTPLTSMLSLAGQGSVDLSADMAIKDTYGLYITTRSGQWGTPTEAMSIVSHGALSFTATSPYSAYGTFIVLNEKTSFENQGSITVASAPTGWSQEVAIRSGALVTNSGTISLDGAIGVSGATKVINSGSITQVAGGADSIGLSGISTLTNTGTIQTGGAAVTLNNWLGAAVTNSGRITSTNGTAIQGDYWSSPVTVTNQAGGEISGATGAIRTGYYNDTIRNDGAITGDIDLSYGDDRIENYGVITGAVSMGDGNDTFVQWVGATMTGTVDGGAGLDTLTIDSTGGGSVLSSQFVNFERFNQIGGGSLTYGGTFNLASIALDGGSATVLAGSTVSTTGANSFTGGAGAENLVNNGVISGGVALGAGVDTVINRGVIGGSVNLGSGDDTYTEGWGSTLTGSLAGGSGVDTYIVELAGDRTGLHARTGFENLGVSGSGALTLTLDQNWSQISLEGANLYLTSGAYTVDGVSGGSAAETLGLDADIAQVNLGGGDDSLLLARDQLAGAYAGGAGADTVRFTATTPVTISGTLSGFETLVLDGGQLNVSGALGATGDTLAFAGTGGQTLSILSGGSLSGTVDLGAGDDTFNLAAGGQLLGTVLGGAGEDRVAIDLTSDLSLRGDQLQQFETLQVTGTGALNFTGGAAHFDHLVTSSQTLSVAAGSSLAAGDLTLDGAANTLTVAGAFTGALDMGAGDDVLRLTTGGTFSGSANGGAGSDRLELALGGTDAAPIALGATPFVGFETLNLQSGVVSMAGDYGFDAIQVSSGRLIGLAGSRLAATTINVAQGATFGSAGAVVGDITVAGTLSPGASPGTMTVTGNVTLASGSTSLFELTPTVSDKLVVSGKVTIAQGAALKLTGASSLTPGKTQDLIVAGGGITGAYTTIDGAQGLNLYVRQSATRLQLLGLFTTDTTFSSQVSGVITTLNNALIADAVGAPLAAAMSSLVDPTTGKSDARALARLTPQAYASASQLAAEDGLSIVDASRAQARFAPETPGLFGFGQAIASRRTLDGDAAVGVAKGRVTTLGGLSGVGYGMRSAWVGAFVGYLNGSQRISDLDAHTSTDSFVIGAQGQVRIGGFQLGAMAAHDGADADTRRTAPGGAGATASYKLKSWVGDVNLSYRAALNADWVVQPRLGASYVRTTRDAFAERGGGVFALNVQGQKTADWFVDGQVEVLGGQAAGQRLHPYASVGFRTRAGGDDAVASATLSGLPTPLTVTGLNRDGTLATAGAGVGYDLSPALKVSAGYTGEFGDGGRQGVLVGLNWSF